MVDLYAIDDQEKAGHCTRPVVNIRERDIRG